MPLGRVMAEVFSLRHVPAVFPCDTAEPVVPDKAGEAVLLPLFIDEGMNARFQIGNADFGLGSFCIFSAVRERR